MSVPDDPNALLDLGNRHLKQGDPDAAIACFSRVMELRPDSVVPAVNLGCAHFNAGDSEQALRAFQRALDIDPRCPEAHHWIGVIRFGREDYEAAADCFRRVLEIDAKNTDIEINLATTLYRLGAFDEALHSFQRALAVEPRAAKAHAGVGAILFERNAFDEAADALKRAAAIDPDLGYGEVCFFGTEFRTLADPERFPEIVSKLPEMTGAFPKSTGAGPVVMTSCDHGYFRTFGHALALSVDRHAPDTDLHLHVISPDPSFGDEVEALRDRLGHTSVTVTTEAAPGTDRVYYHAIRFVRLCQILEATGREFLHLDTDSLVRAPLASVNAIDAGADLAVSMRFFEFILKSKVLISTLFVRQHPMTRRFLRRYGTYLGDRIIEGKVVWGLDQAAFYIVHRMMAFEGEAVSLADLPRALCDHALREDSEIWAAKGARKRSRAFEHERAAFMELLG